MLQATNAASIPSIEEESDEEPEEDEFYLQKFDSELRNNFILNHHPEARTHNYEEVKAMSRVSRDGRGVIVDKLHKTLPFLTKYEMTRVLGQRAKQLDSGAKAFVKMPLNVIDGYHIAKLELEQKKIPFIIKRPFPNGGVEYWNVSDLEVL
jgi:DNA-directed RNA polymerase subunit K/omega